MRLSRYAAIPLLCVAASAWSQSSTPLRFVESPVSLPSGARSFVSANCNRDNLPDIVFVFSRFDLYAGVLLSSRDGAPKLVETNIGGDIRVMQVADFNADGLCDILILGSTLRVHLGKGDGTFGPQIAARERPSESALVIGDLNGDRLPDLITLGSPFSTSTTVPNVISGYDLNTAKVSLGNGDGTFREPYRFAAPRAASYASPGEIALGTTNSNLALADLNGDGKLDFILTHSYSGSFAVMLGNGDGTFQQPVLASVQDDIHGIAVSDFDNDGKSDLVVAHVKFGPKEMLTATSWRYPLISTGLSFLRGVGNGTFREPEDIPFGKAVPLTMELKNIVTADFNKDGITDFVVGGYFATQALVFTGRERQTPVLAATIAASLLSPVVTVADFNGDGYPDIQCAGFFLNVPPPDPKPAILQNGVVSTASSESALAPGGLTTLYGSGLATPRVLVDNTMMGFSSASATLSLDAASSIGADFEVPAGEDLVLGDGHLIGRMTTGGGKLTLRIHEDAAGTPGKVVESMELRGLPMGSYPAVTPFTTTGATILSAGRRYWLSASLTDRTDSAEWRFIAFPDRGNAVFSRDNATWNLISSDRPAFRITAYPRARTTTLPRSLGTTTVLIGGEAAPLLFAAYNQINFQIPWETPQGNVEIIVKNGQASNPTTVNIRNAAPSLFVGNDSWAIAQNADYSLNTSATPAKVGTYLVLYATGCGRTSPPAVTGEPARLSPLSAVTGVLANFSGTVAPVAFAGLTPGLIGVCQINVQVPRLPAGRHQVQIAVGDAVSNSGTVAIVP